MLSCYSAPSQVSLGHSHGVMSPKCHTAPGPCPVAWGRQEEVAYEWGTVCSSGTGIEVAGAPVVPNHGTQAAPLGRGVQENSLQASSFSVTSCFAGSQPGGHSGSRSSKVQLWLYFLPPAQCLCPPSVALPWEDVPTPGLPGACCYSAAAALWLTPTYLNSPPPTSVRVQTGPQVGMEGGCGAQPPGDLTAPCSSFMIHCFSPAPGAPGHLAL